MDTVELDELDDVLLETLELIDVDEVVVVGVDTDELDEELKTRKFEWYSSLPRPEQASSHLNLGDSVSQLELTAIVISSETISRYIVFTKVKLNFYAMSKK